MSPLAPTDEQREALRRTGRFVLRACPGSGKTYTVALRLADRLGSWPVRHAGVAALSFTNVACVEIEQALTELGVGNGVRSPHFLGTLDSFIDTFIFLPFGHRVMRCNKRPVLVGFDGRPWSQTGRWAWGERDCYNKGCDLTHFTWDLEGGGLVDIRPRPASCSLGHVRCRAMKDRFAQAGFATQTDAAYWAVRILEGHPWLARALVRRFPQLLVDEAQDTSKVQMRIIDILVEAGLTEVVLVGDPDQAIYEWRTAHPELMQEKARQTDTWNVPAELTQNLRSTQAICNATHPFSTLRQPAQGRAGGVEPELWRYEDDHPEALVERFVGFCGRQSIAPTPESAALLVRGRALLRRILGVVDGLSPWRDDLLVTKHLARAAWERDQRRIKVAMRHLEAAVIRLLGQDPMNAVLRDLVPGHPDSYLSVVLHRLQKVLPSSSIPLRPWLDSTREAVARWAAGTGWTFPTDPVTSLGVKGFTTFGKNTRFTDFLDWPLTAFFDGPAQPLLLTVDTIHSAKGKTYDAVLLALPALGDCNPKALAEADAGAEVMRTAYVAMTRPRHLLVVAVPRKTPGDRLERFRGFVAR